MSLGIPTPHISETDKSKIAKTVLMPGDPLRAKMIAETYLEDVVEFNNVRGMLGFTGKYNGRTISVMGSGMGMPSCGIYTYELYKFYDVENIIRIGSTGAYTADLNLYDTILVSEAWSESSYAKVQSGLEDDVISASSELNEELSKNAKELGINVVKGRIHSSDVFYRENFLEYKTIRDEKGCMAVEMESFALFHNANVLGKKAACLLTVSDNLETAELTTSEERQTAFHDMIKIALEMAE